MTSQQLDYARRPAIFTRKRTRWIVAAVIVLALGLAAILQRRNIDIYQRQARDLYFQRQCLNFSSPPDHVVYDDDPARAAALLARPDYTPLQLTHGTAVVWRDSHMPWLWFHTTTAPPGTTALLFMHERFTPKGERFILTCELVPLREPGGAIRPGLEIVEFRPATWQTRITRRNALAMPMFEEIEAAMNAGKPVRIYAGQPDPNDRTHYTIRYEIDGVEGFLDGYEGDRTEDADGAPTPGLRLEIRKPK